MKKIALVIGNANYDAEDFCDLANAVQDAKTIATNLQDRGFETALHTDLNSAQMSDVLAAFHAKIATTRSFAVFYYAGHGCEQHGLTYLHPVNIPSGKASAIPQYGVPMSEILGETPLEATPRVLILDCCRTGESSWTSDERGRFEELAKAAGHRDKLVQLNTLIAYSTSSGEAAFDGIGSNGPYCRQLSPLLLLHRMTVEDVFKEVCMQVTAASNGHQRPWFYSNLSSDLTFSDLPNIVPTVAVATPHHNGTGGLVKDPHGPRVIAYRDGQEKAYCVDGVAVYGHHSFINPVQLITTWRNGLMVYDHQHTLQREEPSGQYEGLQLEIKNPLFAVSSPDGNRVIIGSGSSCYLVDISQKRSHEIKIPNQYWYSALFLDETHAWIIGSSGGLLEVNFVNDEPEIREIDIGTKENLYTICRVDSSHLVISGSQGKVLKVLLPDRKIVWIREFGQTVRTPAARMQSILSTTTDNEIIRRFLFEPERLTADQGSCLSDRLVSNDLLFSASAPSSPIIIIASNEGLLYLLDHRDGQLIEVIDNAAGRATHIEGICFLDTEQFAVLDQTGTASFYSLTALPYKSMLRYIDEAEWNTCFASSLVCNAKTSSSIN